MKCTALLSAAPVQRPEPVLDNISIARIKARRFDLTVRGPIAAPDPAAKHLRGVIAQGADLLRADETWERRTHEDVRVTQDDPLNACVFTGVTGDSATVAWGDNSAPFTARLSDSGRSGDN